jgi:acyl carrier protein
MTAVTYDDAYKAMQEIFEDLAEDLGEDEIALSPESKVLDLGVESISLVYLISELQQTYDLGDQLFRKMREEDQLLKDMTVDDILKAVVELSARQNA